VKFAKTGKPSFRPRYGVGARFGVFEPLTSALAHKRTLTRLFRMSALPPKADIADHDCHARFVPKADILRSSKNVPFVDHLVVAQPAALAKGH